MPDIDKLEQEASDMYNEVRAKLDDPDYLFNDGTDEEWCQSLRECATRCRAAGRDLWERQLEIAASDVEKRGGDWK